VRIDTDAPWPVRVAAVVVCLQGLAVLAAAVVLLVLALGGDAQLGNVYAEAGFFVLMALAVLACGVALLLGRQAARTPAVVIQVLLLGVAWYAIGPSGRPEYGAPVAAVSVAVLVLLFTAQGRAWADDEPV
jgi:predicted signal transduction protein with EAL and GGDEF domain